MTPRILCAIASLFMCTGALAQASSWDEFLGGQRATFSSAGQAKANGLEISFDYPVSWIGVDGKRPHVLHQVTSEHGKGLELCNLTVRDLPLPRDYKPTKEEIDELFTPSYVANWLPSGGEILRSSKTAIDGQPSALIEYRQEVNRAGMAIKMQWVVFPIYYDKRILVFGCGVGASSATPWDAVQARFNTFLPLFQQIASSVIIHSRWNSGVRP